LSTWPRAQVGQYPLHIGLKLRRATRNSIVRWLPHLPIYLPML
jgi:hypothetical protein